MSQGWDDGLLAQGRLEVDVSELISRTLGNTASLLIGCISCQDDGFMRCKKKVIIDIGGGGSHRRTEQ